MRLALPGNRRWLLVLICITIPALALAVLGLRSLVGERDAENARIAQTALLADTLINDRAIEGAAAPGGGALSFRLTSSGSLTFPQCRVYFTEVGAEPDEADAVAPLPPAVEMAEELLAAEALGDLARAREIAGRLTVNSRLSLWADFIVTRIESRRRPERVLEWIGAHSDSLDDALSPERTPVIIMAARLARAVDSTGANQAVVQRAFKDLRGGRWWLPFQARKLYDEELRAGLGDHGLIDPALTDLEVTERALRRTAPFPREGTARIFVKEFGSPMLLVVSGSGGGAWTGTALIGTALRSSLEKLLSPLQTASYPLALADRSGLLLWGSTDALRSGRSLSVGFVDGWRIHVGRAGSGMVRSQFLWIGFVIALLAMLAVGLTLSVRTARREMELARLQAEFTASVTHEFKSPISGIRLLVERLLAGRLSNSGTAREYYVAVDREAGRLERLVNRILESHRIQSGQNCYHFAPHHIDDIAQTAISNLQVQADAKRITLTLHTDDVRREMDVDGTAVQDCLENLLENAIKYSPPGGAVELTLEHGAEELRAVVRDSGGGIDAADLPHIFERYYRGRRESASVRGAGLGLSLVKAIVEGHGGLVEVNSAPGCGSEFCLHIPYRLEKANAAGADRG